MASGKEGLLDNFVDWGVDGNLRNEKLAHHWRPEFGVFELERSASPGCKIL
jgi:hypothetical protein